ncbi:MAG: M15 family metallopeptidase [Bacteroidota bacterium]
MTLREKQSIFLRNVAKLVLWAFENGYELTGGELQRTQEQQEVYVNEGLSKTLNSQHLKKLAIDLHLFISGQYKSDKESHTPLGEYWESLNENNVWGGRWGFDANHYEMK